MSTKAFLSNKSFPYYSAQFKQGACIFYLIFNIGKQKVVAHGNPYLAHDCIFTSSKERFYLQVLLYPFEEKLDLPPRFVDFSGGRCRKFEVVG